MPWSLSKREGKWCVIKDSDGSSAGCHDSRADAIRQQRALYANESRMASMYAELDAMVDEYEEAVEVVPEIDVTSALADALAGLSEKERRLNDRERQVNATLVAAIQQFAEKETTINVEPPAVTVNPPAVTVEAPEVIVHPPSVSVNPEIHLPPSTRKVKFERDILSDKLISAEITEE